MCDVQRVKRDVQESSHQFVCTGSEFKRRYGRPTSEDAEELRPYVVVCRDGMIRPRTGAYSG